MDGSARSQGRKWYGQKAIFLLVGGFVLFVVAGIVAQTSLEVVLPIFAAGGFLSMGLAMLFQVVALVYLAVERFSPIASKDDSLEMGFRRVI